MSVNTEILIMAPGQAVFDLFTDLSKAKARLSGVQSIEILEERKAGAGTRWRETRIVSGMPVIQVMTVTAVDPPRSVTVASENFGATYETHFTFAPDGGGTRVKAVFSAKPSNPLGALFAPALLFLEPFVKPILEQDMADLKRAAENP